MAQVAVYIEGQQTFIDTPRAAHHIIELKPGEVVDIVMQNQKQNANGVRTHNLPRPFRNIMSSCGLPRFSRRGLTWVHVLNMGGSNTRVQVYHQMRVPRIALALLSLPRRTQNWT